MVAVVLLVVLAVCAVLLFATPYIAVFITKVVFALPSQTPPQDYEQISRKVEVHRDIKYSSTRGRNMLDIYLPRSFEGNLPTIIWMHGGGYITGDKKDIEHFATSLAAEGYAVVCPNYALAPGTKYPEQVRQLGEVYSFVKDSQGYGFDDKRLVLAGDSAGAHIVSQFVGAQLSSAYAQLIGVDQTVDADTIKAVLLYSGPFDFERIGTSKNTFFDFMIARVMWAYYGTSNWREKKGFETTMKYHVTHEFPPCFITDGNTGSFERDAKELEASLLDVGVEGESFYIDVNTEKASHEYQFVMDSPAAVEALKRSLCFLADHVGER